MVGTSPLALLDRNLLNLDAARITKVQIAPDKPENAVAQATRLLGLPRARVQIEIMIEDWLELGTLDATKRSTAFPEMTPAVLAAMHDELRRFVDHGY